MAQNNSASKDVANKNGSKKKPVVAIVIAVVVVVVAVIAGVIAWRSLGGESVESLKASCAEVSEQRRMQQNVYNTLVNGDAAAASAYTEDQVNDPDTLAKLADELDVKTPELGACNVETADEFKTQISKIESNTTWYKDHTASLQKAVDAVNASVKK
ncbi:hypothetical protein [Bifidobacterium leontopitheci]|uniref:Colicin transporter n=1 Tax=Bifidobacterium leontopitheci TaxID=2650774 RepID=A0A6I1GTW3_9BIFI|nr:hypothetical protein [Bifidobacterium leontopitheci]KAB7789901.1 hypothetical protein F7D09_1625 [Bifidobacterium leontopitheci]